MENFWDKPDWEVTDLQLKKLRTMPFERPFPSLPVSTNPNETSDFYLIRGPRQVGKSSWLKLILSQVVRTYGAQHCFYLSCENIADYRELSELLASLRGKKAVLLDEISFVAGWDRSIKHALDAGYFNKLYVTGSHAHELKKGADRMPGRFGGGGEIVLMPMSFEEFQAARKQANWSASTRLEELQAYFRTGGFPLAVAEGGKDGHIPKEAIDTYLRWLIGDCVKLGKSEDLLRELLIQIAVVLQTPISLQTLAKKSNIGSHNTVRDYLEVLNSCFATRTLYAIDGDTGSFRFKKDRKIYFTDPLLYWMGLELSGKRISAEDTKRHEEKLAEQVAHEHLTRTCPRMGYYSSKKGEVDFVLPRDWAVEVKWAPEALGLSRAYLDLTYPDKKVWTQRNFLE